MTKPQVFIIINILIIIFSFLFISFLGKRMSNNVLEYSKTEAAKISQLIATYAINKNIINNIPANDLIVADKNSDNEIKSINFNIKEVNLLLSTITNNILTMFRDLENGKSSVIDLSKNILTNAKIKGYKKGIIFEIPMGIISDNFILSNLGPKIPVKLSLSGNLSSHISTSIVECGINSALLTLYINIDVSVKIMLPFLTDQVTTHTSVPISMSFINGKIPNYYTNGMNSNSPILNLPIN